MLILVFLIAACAPAAPATVEVVKTVEVEKQGPITVGYGAPSLDSFQTNVMMSMTKYAQDKGWQVVTSNANFDADAQANEVDYWTSLGVDAIVVVPIDSKAICSSVKKAHDAGIPFFTIDRAPTGCEIEMTVQADNELGGKQSAEAIVGFLTEKYGSPKGTVLELQGDMGQNVAQLRSKGFNDVMAQYPDIKVVSKPTEWKGEKFQQATMDVVGSQDVDAIYSHSDTVGTLPILSALDQLGKKIKAGEDGHIYLATIDGSSTCLNAIREGFQDQCSSQPNPDFGILVNYIDMVLNKQPIEEGEVVKEGAPWSPATIFKSDTGMMLNLATTNVTAENVDDPALWGNVIK
jgi:ABC-type sugar transport system substrate-binding protein